MFGQKKDWETRENAFAAFSDSAKKLNLKASTMYRYALSAFARNITIVWC